MAMVLRACLRPSGCSACRASVLSAFVSHSSPPFVTTSRGLPSTLSPIQAPTSVVPSVFLAPVARPRFTSTRPSPPSEDAGADGSGPGPGIDGPDAKASEESPGDTPWYLEEEPPRHPTLVQQTSPLPAIPRGAPRILGELVQFADEDMGLDDLKILDLRTLDPPAALGPRLLMFFGTARSERHLHVSAGHLKSWLRRKGINAHADGHLGPKELKIKLRRLRKREKLMGTSGMTPNHDDGISTRWVCVNLGTVGTARDGADVETEIESSDGRIAGFGRASTGNTIVVQMFTGSRRKELDLETLWTRILRRRGNDDVLKDDLDYIEAGTHPDELPTTAEGNETKFFATPSRRRFFSTSSRRPTASSSPGSGDHITQVNDQISQQTAMTEVDKTTDPAGWHVIDKIASLQRLQARVIPLPHEDACKTMSHTEDGGPSDFVDEWNQAIRHLPRQKSWPFRLWLHLTGRRLGLPEYSFQGLRQLTQEMQVSCFAADRQQYLDILKSIYLAGSSEPKDTAPLRDRTELALQLLRTASERGEAILAADAIISIIESLGTRKEHKEAKQLQTTLERLLRQADLPYMGEDLLARLMSVYVYQDDWDKFWEAWRIPPKHGVARSQELYLFLFSRVAATGLQIRCTQAVRWTLNEMLNEVPPVRPTGSLKSALLACMRIAEPHAEAIAKSSSLPTDWNYAVRQEFARLFKFVEQIDA